MLLDAKNEFWDGQALTSGAESRSATVAEGNGYLDLESLTTDEQIGPLWWNILISVAAGGMDSGGYFQLVTSDSATFSTGNVVIGAWGSAADPLTAAILTAGKGFALAVNPLAVMKKYVEAEWIPISEDASGLTVDSWMGLSAVKESVAIQKAVS